MKHDYLLYRRWHAMSARCHDPRHPRYASYGGRGIQVCEEWRWVKGDKAHNEAAYARFMTYMGPMPFDEATIDREDNNAGYFPGNVRWATPKEQANNKRNNLIQGPYSPLPPWPRKKRASHVSKAMKRYLERQQCCD